MSEQAALQSYGLQGHLRQLTDLPQHSEVLTAASFGHVNGVTTSKGGPLNTLSIANAEKKAYLISTKSSVFAPEWFHQMEQTRLAGYSYAGHFTA